MLGSSCLRVAVTAIAARRNVVSVKTVRDMTFRQHFDGACVSVQQLRPATAERNAFFVFSAPGVESVGYSGRPLDPLGAENMQVERSPRDGRLYLQAAKQSFADYSAKPATRKKNA